MQANEEFGQSFFRDHVNKEKRKKIAYALGNEQKYKIKTSFKSPATDRLLTERLERNIEILLKKWLGGVTHVDYDTVKEILVKLDVFSSEGEV